MATPGDGLYKRAATEAGAMITTSESKSIAIQVEQLPIDIRFLTPADVEKLSALAELPKFVIDGIAEHMKHEKDFGAQLMPLYCPTHNAWVAREIKVFSANDQQRTCQLPQHGFDMLTSGY